MRKYQCHRVVVAVSCRDAVFQPDGSVTVSDSEAAFTLPAKMVASRTEEEIRSGWAYCDWDGKRPRWMGNAEFTKHYTMLPEH